MKTWQMFMIAAWVFVSPSISRDLREILFVMSFVAAIVCAAVLDH